MTRFNPEYFERLRQRVVRAGERGFYVSVMLFNGWSIHDNGEGNPWDRHPFNRRNNVNGIDGDPDARGEGSDVHTLRVPAVTRLQEAYLEQVVATVGGPGSRPLGDLERESPGVVALAVPPDPVSAPVAKCRREPHLIGRLIGMTACFPGNRNEDLFGSPADWVSPGNKGGWRRDPPPADGSKCGPGGHGPPLGDRRRPVGPQGFPPVTIAYMDPLDDGLVNPVREAARREMGRAMGQELQSLRNFKG